MNSRLTKLSQCIRFVTMSSLAASLAVAPSVMAQESDEDAENVEKIAVVGTRAAPRSVGESAVPIDIIGAEDFKQQGSTDMVSMMQSAVPSFNVNEQPINDASTLVRPANLRGMASDHTLILVNGKRRHRSAVITFLGGGLSDGAQGPDISTIPAIALKQIEVLRDGAAAQYGSDAIAGVINFALKDDSEGGAVEVQYGEFGEGDGTTYQVAGNVGLALTDDGFVNLSMEYREADPTSRSVQRADASQLIADGNTFVRTPAAQVWGNPEVRDDFKFFGNAGLDLGDNKEAYMFGNYATRTVEGGFFFRNPLNRGGVNAGPFESGDVDGDGVVGDGEGFNTLLVGDLTGDMSGNCPTIRVGDSINGFSGYNPLTDPAYIEGVQNNPDCFAFNEMFPGGFTPFFGGDVTDVSFVIGTSGELDNEVFYDISFNFGENEIDYFIRNTINASFGPATPTEFRPGRYTQTEKTFDIDLSKPFDVGLAEPLFVAGGFQYRHETYESIAGNPESYEIGPLGTQGFSSGSNGFGGLNVRSQGEATRHNIAFYLDVEAYLTEDFLLTGALRYEDFSDFGNTTKGKVSFRYQASDTVAFRGAYATGFKAPTIGQSSVSNITTAIGSGGVLIDTALLPPTNPIAVQKGAVALTPEESESISLGLVADFDNGFFLTLDYYNIELTDRIATTSQIAVTPADVEALLAQGIAEARNFTAVSFFNNDFDTTTEGVDLVANYAFDMAGGDTKVSLAYNWTETSVDEASPNISAGRIRMLEDNLPNIRYTLQGVHTNDDWTFLARLNYFGAIFEDHVDANLAFPLDAGSEYTVDAEIGYNVNDNLKLTLGAKNLFDQTPDENPHALAFGAQYPTTSPIGMNGGFYYARAQYNF